MKKFRTYKKYSLVYSLEKNDIGYNVSIQKCGENGTEISSYIVNGIEKELKALLCRLWSCGVTPMSLVYILEDEGYIPHDAVENDDGALKASDRIVRRNCPCAGTALKFAIENTGADKPLAAIGGKSE